MRVSVFIARGIVLGWSIFVALGLTSLSERMAPIRDGNAAGFWRIAVGVSPDGEREQSFGGDAYIVDETWAAYEVTHMHGSYVYKVPVSALDAGFDGVRQRLQESSVAERESVYKLGFSTWLATNPHSRDYAALIDAIKEAGLRRSVVEDPNFAAEPGEKEQLFWHRWERAKWYWANFAFEWLYLTWIVLFAFWPTVLAKGAWPQAIHIAALPLLFLLPTYLGYATYSFTSAGPSGGVLYPFLLFYFAKGQCNPIDLWLLDHTPRLLEPLSIPIGTPMVLSGRGFPGPSTAVVIGLLMASIYLAFRIGIRRWRSGRVGPVDYEQTP